VNFDNEVVGAVQRIKVAEVHHRGFIVRTPIHVKSVTGARKKNSGSRLGNRSNREHVM
jgi:hypothetical protein